MPIYEYLCQDCGAKFEKLVRRAGPESAPASEMECPSCGQKHLKQEYSTFAAHTNASPKSAEMPSCPSGRCSNPGMCGMNFN
jgi:putative FmdB family regulatory protein